MSATNLLPLLNQLQYMENTLTNLMLETILKLQSLTDVKVFLLIDSNQKRRYCGSKELTDVFEGGEGLICSRSADIAVRLDTAVKSLVESPPPCSSTMATILNYAVAGETSYASGVMTTENATAPSSSLLDVQHDKPMSVVSLSSGDQFEQETHSANFEVGGLTASKRKKVDDLVTTNKGRVSSSSSTENGELCKKEHFDEIPEYVISDEEDDGDEADPVSFLMDVSNIDFSSPDGSRMLRSGVGAGGGDDTVVTSNDTVMHPFIEPQFFFDALTDVDREIQKYNAIMNVKDPSVLYQRNAVESKLLKSVAYSVGKNAALKCPYPFEPQNRDALLSYWSHYSDLLVGQCANVGLLIDKKTVNSTTLDLIHHKSSMNHIRQSVRDGFKKVAQRYRTGK